MSKITSEKKAKKENSGNSQPKQGSQKNEGKCCSCAYYPQHVRGEAQPCKFKKAYVARKCDACTSYKCKFR